MLPALIAAGTALLGGKMASNSVKQTNAQSEALTREGWDRAREDYALARVQDRRHQEYLDKDRNSWIVEGAQKAGINPLTALGASGGYAGGGSIAAPGQAALSVDNSMGQAVASAGQSIANALDPITIESRKLDNELKKIQIETAKSQAVRLGQGVPQVRKSESPVKIKDVVNKDLTGGPVQGPLQPPDHQPRIEVFLPYSRPGKPLVGYLNSGIAERYGLARGDVLTPEDMTMLYGEVTGEAGNTLNFDAVMDTMLKTGVLSDGPSNAADDREKAAKKEAKKQAREKFTYGGNETNYDYVQP